jgi:hypothetical protein
LGFISDIRWKKMLPSVNQNATLTGTIGGTGRLPDFQPVSSLSYDSAVLTAIALPSDLWAILSSSSPLLARHMAQLAAAVANVA